ncbi:MAG TPA: hypothetical protein VF843_11315 [Streptosporangiaceae bacterium]
MFTMRTRLPLVVLSAAALAAVGGSAVTASAAVRQAGQPRAVPASSSGRAARGPAARTPAAALAARLGLPAARRVPTPGSSSVLNNIYCVAASDCWAVGDYATAHQGTRNQILHWTGKAWRTVAAPNPGGSAGSSVSELFGIRCTSSRNCWAVGYYTGRQGFRNEALRWNGSRWTVVSTPQPGTATSGRVDELFDVTCVSASHCWAVGQDGVQGGTTVSRNEILRWNGRSWRLVRGVPNPAGTTSGDINGLSAIRCSTASHCLAVGEDGLGLPLLRNEAMRWNGRTWSVMKTPQPGGTSPGSVNALIGLTCASPDDCWAAGTDGTFSAPITLVNEVLHWNGSKWRLAAVPNPDGTGGGASNELFGDFCSNSQNCWAVGDYGSISGGVGSILTEALHWNGATWTHVTTPSPGGTADKADSELFAVRCSRPSACWAVGSSQTPTGRTKNVLLEWNGTSWSVH